MNHLVFSILAPFLALGSFWWGRHIDTLSLRFFNGSQTAIFLFSTVWNPFLIIGIVLLLV